MEDTYKRQKAFSDLVWKKLAQKKFENVMKTEVNLDFSFERFGTEKEDTTDKIDAWEGLKVKNRRILTPLQYRARSFTSSITFRNEVKLRYKSKNPSGYFVDSEYKKGKFKYMVWTMLTPDKNDIAFFVILNGPILLKFLEEQAVFIDQEGPYYEDGKYHYSLDYFKDGNSMIRLPILKLPETSDFYKKYNKCCLENACPEAIEYVYKNEKMGLY